MARKDDSKSTSKTGPASKAKTDNSTADMGKGKEAPAVKTTTKSDTGANKTQKKR
jgi:hypothetical protein